MKVLKSVISIGLLVLGLSACKARESNLAEPGKIQLITARVGSYLLDKTNENANLNAPADKAVVVEFSTPLDTALAQQAVQLVDASAAPVAVSYTFPDENRSVSMKSTADLAVGKKHKIQIASSLKGKNGFIFGGTSVGFTVKIDPVAIDSLKIGVQKVGPGRRITNVNYRPEIKVWFSVPIKEASLLSNTLVLNSKLGNVPFTQSLSTDKKVLTLLPTADLNSLTRYRFEINNTLSGAQNEPFTALSQFFYTELDRSDKFPLLGDEELLTLVQRQTLKYFYDFSHPISGLAPERNATPNIVTIGGSGFGVMALIVGVERGFITRSQGVDQWFKIVDFLKRADRFHGVWPHWLNGTTGKTVAFSPDDDGGDLVETAFMIQGLITLKQYLNRSNSNENRLVGKIDSLCNEVEWDWYRRDNQNVLYWHWSPRVGWRMNFPLRGWNETLIPYVLAATSTTHTIPKEVYTNGHCTGNRFLNGQSYFGFPLPLGEPLGGPLFFAHYSQLGLNPTQLRDPFANYWTQNVNHTKINHAYCVANPKNYVGYSADCWGLTASDNQSGYSAHSPTNDLGVITPTAALSSFPYTPVESMRALKHFYYKLGDRTWGNYGFYDAFNPTEDWYGRTYLAIDQGPIVVMLENYRTGLLWNLFMSAPEVQQGLTKLGFSY